jgi:MFS family permease
MTGLVVLAIATACAAAVRSTWSPCGLSMLSTITPLTERARGHRYGATVAWFVFGALAGGAALGVLAAALALGVHAIGVPATAAYATAAALALIGLAADLGLAGVRVPTHPRQVNETWLGRYRRWIYAAGFGVQIGSGLATYVMTAAVYLTIALAALTGSPALAFGVGVLFGAIRGLAVLAGHTATTPERTRELHARLHAAEPASRHVAAAAQAAVAVAATGWAAGTALPAVVAAAGYVLYAAVEIASARLAVRRTPTLTQRRRRQVLPVD